MIELKDEELSLRLRNFEDNFVERKTSGDSKDWLKTVVAFANSTPVGYPAVLFIGVKDDGTPGDRTADLDSLQQTFSKKLSDAYPHIYCFPRVVNADGKELLAVIVPGSADTRDFESLGDTPLAPLLVATKMPSPCSLCLSRFNTETTECLSDLRVEACLLTEDTEA